MGIDNTFRTRMHQFTKNIRRFHAMWQLGDNTKQLVRAAGVPAILYGCETSGLSDLALRVARTRIAKAAAPQAGGKNPDATLYALDGAFGMLDPAFEAHAAPLRHWATAWWERWFKPAVLDLAFWKASLKLAAGRGHMWSKVTGDVGWRW